MNNTRANHVTGIRADFVMTTDEMAQALDDAEINFSASRYYDYGCTCTSSSGASANGTLGRISRYQSPITCNNLHLTVTLVSERGRRHKICDGLRTEPY
jgi:iron only hydrogenase large subunit-like protein